MPTRTEKRAFDWESTAQALGHPAVVGSMLGAAPGLVRGLAAPTGGLGLFGAVDLLRNRGANFGAFFRGPLGNRGPAINPVASVGKIPVKSS